MGRRQGRTTTAPGNDAPGTAHEIQYETGEGPCLDAIWDSYVVQIDDLANDRRWPDFRVKALDAGLRSVLCFQLFTYQDTLGSLNMFGRRPRAFGADARDLGLIFASHTAVALAAAREQVRLSEAIASRQRIGEATGILAERYGVTTRQAFTMLAQAARDHQVKVTDLAYRIVASKDRSPAATPAPGDAPPTPVPPPEQADRPSTVPPPEQADRPSTVPPPEHADRPSSPG